MNSSNSYTLRISILALAAALALIAPIAHAQTISDIEPLIAEPAMTETVAEVAATETEVSPTQAEIAAPQQFVVFLPLILTPGAASSEISVPAEVQQAVALTNQYRTAAQCQPLKISAQLTSAASAHSQDMASHNFFSHTGSDGSLPWDRIRRTGYSYSSAGENIAAGYYTAESVVQGWYNSPGHRANMLNCNYTEIGIAYADGGAYGRYWTQVFAKPR